MALTTAFYYTPGGRSIQDLCRGNWRSDDRGRIGGLTPDQVVSPEAMTQLRAVLDATGAFTDVRDRYIQRVRSYPENFEVTPAIAG